MKILAHISNNYNSDIYPINLACWLKKNKPEDWESRDYYDLAKLRPMRPSCRKDGGSSYSYKPGTNPPGHGRGSKGIAHELVQEYICRLEGSMWQFQVFDNNFNVNIQRVEDEYTITDPDDPENYRIIDNMCYLHPDCAYYDYFGGKFGVEVTDTHKTNNKKIALFKKLNLFVFELQTISDWHIENQQRIKKEDVFKLKGRIKGFLAKSPKLWLLSSPMRM
jgi:hypothetical protein